MKYWNISINFLKYFTEIYEIFHKHNKHCEIFHKHNKHCEIFHLVCANFLYPRHTHTSYLINFSEQNFRKSISTLKYFKILNFMKFTIATWSKLREVISKGGGLEFLVLFSLNKNVLSIEDSPTAIKYIYSDFGPRWNLIAP